MRHSADMHWSIPLTTGQIPLCKSNVFAERSFSAQFAVTSALWDIVYPDRCITDAEPNVPALLYGHTVVLNIYGQEQPYYSTEVVYADALLSRHYKVSTRCADNHAAV
ncbi:MAG TPA: hypothetical protein VIM75_03430 [Ohtaekwangia sp.]|uniref:hypothetical protein n=1 Tax=Ohtaekwangia sp. TaxID=2066019 RepID=UPI002F9237CF